MFNKFGWVRGSGPTPHHVFVVEALSSPLPLAGKGTASGAEFSDAVVLAQRVRPEVAGPMTSSGVIYRLSAMEWRVTGFALIRPTRWRWGARRPASRRFSNLCLSARKRCGESARQHHWGATPSAMKTRLLAELCRSGLIAS